MAKINVVSEDKEEHMRAEARAMLGKFSKSLGNVKVSSESNVDGESSGFRIEATTFEKGSRSPKGESVGEESNNDFRQRMFANAPNKEGDFIVAEKKKW